MKKFLLLALLALFASNVANATVLFSFFTDLAPNYDVIFESKEENNVQTVLKGDSGWGGLNDCQSFLDDVIPEDVSKHYNGKYMIVYTSTFHREEVDVVDTKSNMVSAIYLVSDGKSVKVFYTETSGTQQKEWEAQIAGGKL
ncbi:MAG: hypothetical protein ACI31A_05695 [Candidatus Limisoma sp.]